MERLELLTAIHSRGALTLDPPGLSVDLDALFAALPEDESERDEGE
jgi:hypothetical protein